jgi:hypothetical protein
MKKISDEGCSKMKIMGLTHIKFALVNWPRDFHFKFLMHPRLPEDGNHLPKHVWVNLEYINKSN